VAGALDLAEPKHLFAKLERGLAALTADRSDSFAAIDALRDAYHLREWIWHGRLEGDTSLQTAVMGVAGGEDTWNRWVIDRFPEFGIIRDLCNGSKHFRRRSISDASRGFR
jgi:hypothetical protein